MWLKKHADYQRVYKDGRKQFSSLMAYFFSVHAEQDGLRVGLTVPKALGGAVQRNRIKRRMRAAVRRHYGLLGAMKADVVLHPKRTVLDCEFARIEQDVAKVFAQVNGVLARNGLSKAGTITKKTSAQ